MYIYCLIQLLYATKYFTQILPVIPKIGSNIESEDDVHYWIPRVRLMFLAEDPTVFARRVAHAHMSRAKTEALLRYHLYIDCMPTDEMAELDSDSIQRIVSNARSSPRLKQDQYVCMSVCVSLKVGLLNFIGPSVLHTYVYVCDDVYVVSTIGWMQCPRCCVKRCV